MWETHNLSFSHIVLLLFNGPPSPPTLPSPLPSPKPLMPQKILSPLCPWTAERSELAIHSSVSSPGRKGTDRPKGEWGAYHTKELNPLGHSGLSRVVGVKHVTFSLGANSKRAARTRHCYAERAPSGRVRAGGVSGGGGAALKPGPGKEGGMQQRAALSVCKTLNGKSHVRLEENKLKLLGREALVGGWGTEAGRTLPTTSSAGDEDRWKIASCVLEGV